MSILGGRVGHEYIQAAQMGPEMMGSDNRAASPMHRLDVEPDFLLHPDVADAYAVRSSDPIYSGPIRPASITVAACLAFCLLPLRGRGPPWIPASAAPRRRIRR